MRSSTVLAILASLCLCAALFELAGAASTPTHIETWVNCDGQNGCLNVSGSYVHTYVTTAHVQIPQPDASTQAYADCVTVGTPPCTVSQYIKPYNIVDQPDCGVGGVNPPDYEYVTVAFPTPDPSTGHGGWQWNYTGGQSFGNRINRFQNCTSPSPGAGSFLTDPGATPVQQFWSNPPAGGYLQGNTTYGGRSEIDFANFLYTDITYPTVDCEANGNETTPGKTKWWADDAAMIADQNAFENAMEHDNGTTPWSIWINAGQCNQVTYSLAQHIASSLNSSNVVGYQCENCLQNGAGGSVASADRQVHFVVNTASVVIYGENKSFKVRHVENLCANFSSTSHVTAGTTASATLNTSPGSLLATGDEITTGPDGIHTGQDTLIVTVSGSTITPQTNWLHDHGNSAGSASWAVDPSSGASATLGCQTHNIQPSVVQDEINYEAVVLLFYKPGYTYSDTVLGGDVGTLASPLMGAYVLNVWPVQGIVPSEPVITPGAYSGSPTPTPAGVGGGCTSGDRGLTGGVEDLLISEPNSCKESDNSTQRVTSFGSVPAGIYIRPFGDCTAWGTDIGACAALVNETSTGETRSFCSTVTPFEVGGNGTTPVSVDLTGFHHYVTINTVGPMADGTDGTFTTGGTVASTSDLNISGHSWSCSAPNLAADTNYILTP